MATATTVGAFLAGLKSQLAGRPGLAGVTVTLAPAAPDETPLDDLLCLVWAPIRASDVFAVAGNQRARDETATIPGCVRGYKISRSGGDDAFQAAFDRAETILSELIGELRDNLPPVGRQTRSGRVSSIVWTPSPVDKGGWLVQGNFDVTYTSRVS